jgi:hypothetical protein
MIAEAKIRTGSDIDGGLTLVDQMRDAQGAGLAHIAGTGLTQAQAIEQFRCERRVGLYMRGFAFYDARRWGVTAPAASGGVRSNANVLVPGSLVDSSSALLLPCFIEYDYLVYWDVPQNELDFNPATSTSAPVKNFVSRDLINFSPLGPHKELVLVSCRIGKSFRLWRDDFFLFRKSIGLLFLLFCTNNVLNLYSDFRANMDLL